MTVPPTGNRPYLLQVHYFGKASNPDSFAIELAPTVGRWSPLYVGFPIRDRGAMEPVYLAHGLRGDAWYARRLRHDIKQAGHSESLMPIVTESASSDGEWWIMRSSVHANTVQSVFLCCRRIPALLVFGSVGGKQENALLVPDLKTRPRHVPKRPKV
jgi:hypothetical protein